MFRFPIHRDFRITSKYGYRIHPVTGVKVSFHNGLDLAIPANTPLHAPARGTVTSSFYNSKGGNQIIITHPGNIKTGYAHLNSKVAKGYKLKKNEIFAYSGNTGASTGAHLHLTYKKNDNLKDPARVSWQYNKAQNLTPGTKIKKINSKVLIITGILAVSSIYLIKKHL